MNSRASQDGILLITGAAGQVGSALVRELRAAGQSVRAAYHSPPRDMDADSVAIDFEDPLTLRPAMCGVRCMFLLAGMSSRQTVQELAAVHAARDAGVSLVVKLSVWRADEELTPVAQMHRPVELAIEASGMQWTFLRPNFYMQNFTRQMATTVPDEMMIAQPRSNSPISFIDAGDIARVAARVLTEDGHHGHVYDLTGPEALSYADVARIFSEVLGHDVRYVPLNDAEAAERMRVAQVPAFHAAVLLKVAAAYRHGGADRISSAVADLTGRPPRTLREFVDEYRTSILDSGR